MVEVATLVARRRGRAAAILVSMPHRLLCLLTLASALAVPAAAAAATPISLQQRPSTVSSLQGVIAWSDYDAAADQYRLMVGRPGQAPAPAPIAPSAQPFDVTVGDDATGTFTALYTRCAHPGAPSRGDVNPARGTGCDIYALNLDTGVEQHLTRLSAPDADESQPAMRDGEVVFVRRERGRRGHAYDMLRVGGRLPGATRVIARADVTRKQSLADPQLGAGRVAYVVTDPGTTGFGRRTIHVLRRSTGRDQAIYRAQSGGANEAEVTRPSFDAAGRTLYWARTNQGSGAGNRFVRWSAVAGTLSYAVGDRNAVSTSWVDAAAGMLVADAFGATSCLPNVNDPPERSTCSVYTTGPLSFDARP